MCVCAVVCMFVCMYAAFMSVFTPVRACMHAINKAIEDDIKVLKEERCACVLCYVCVSARQYVRTCMRSTRR